MTRAIFILALTTVPLHAECGTGSQPVRGREAANFAGGRVENPSHIFDTKAAERFANLALACVHKEYPNKISHNLSSDKDVAPPRELTPAFYGCYDWHSSVHGHWLLARLARTFPEAPFTPKARAALAESITPAHVAKEAEYLRGAG